MATAAQRRPRWDRNTLAEVLLLCGVLALAAALGFSRIARADYDRDEDQFIASARLLADRTL
jgi:hypothetical protein